MSHIQAVHDGWIRTHDEARQLLKYAALGATVILNRLPREPHENEREGTREFTLVMDAAPGFAVNTRDLYTLPVRELHLARRIRELADAALAALAQSGTLGLRSRGDAGH